MIDIEIEGHKITIYNSAEEMPIRRFQKFQRYTLLESGIGSSLDSISMHYTKLFQLLSFGKTAEAFTEAKNLFYNFHTILEEMPVPGLAFACLIQSVDGVENNDLTEDALSKVVDKLSAFGVSREMIDSRVNYVKKKVFDELKSFCPTYFNNDLDYQFYAKLKSKIATIAQIAEQGETEELVKKLKRIDEELLDEMLPANFDTGSPDNELVKMERNFQALCTILESNGVVNAANLTALEFYSRLEYFKKQAAEMRAANQRIASSAS